MMTIHGEMMAAGHSIREMAAEVRRDRPKESILALATNRTRGHASRAHAIADALENLAERLMGSEPRNTAAPSEPGEPHCELAQLDAAQEYLDSGLNRLQSLAERLNRL